jgi:monoamine oxidase
VVSASTVVVTASTAAIAAGVIDFHPALPVAMREAFAALPCGRAEKVGIAVDGRALGVEDYTTIQYEPARAGSISFQLREDGRDFANAYLAGSICDDLDADGPGAMEACAVDALVDLIGSDVRRSIGTIRRTNWRAEPYILGSYASALPGHADARSVLRQPLGGRVWFAGEALHEEFFSTCHGADLDGRDAVLEALQAIRG